MGYTSSRAKVVTNGKGVPTHIEAETKEEFFEDLKSVLNYIRLHRLFNVLGIIDSDWFYGKYMSGYKQLLKYDGMGYEHVLNGNKMIDRVAESYLFRFLRASTLNTHPITTVFHIVIEFKPDIHERELAFKLPGYDECYTPNLRFLYTDIEKYGFEATPTVFEESVGRESMYKKIEKTTIYISDPGKPKGDDIIPGYYAKYELLISENIVILKLISIDEKVIFEGEMLRSFKCIYNFITDYNGFVKQYKKENE